MCLASHCSTKLDCKERNFKERFKECHRNYSWRYIIFYVLGFYTVIIPSTNLLNNPCNATGILMQQLIEPHQDIFTEILRKLPFCMASDLPERDQFTGIMCEKIGKFMKISGKSLISLGI